MRTKAIIESPNHFGFWIADFGLSDNNFGKNAFINLFFPIQNPKSKIQNLLDDFIRLLEQVDWNYQTNLFCRPEVNDEFKLRRLLHRQISRFRSFEDFVHVASRAPI